MLHGGTGVKETRAVAARLAGIPEDEDRVLLATGRYIGEGFDDSRLDTLFLTLPVSWRGTIAQYVGRLHRLHDGKTEVRVYDYADLNVPMLARMFDRRCAGYEAVGYTVLLPGSAVPGWPVEVPLPVDPRGRTNTRLPSAVLFAMASMRRWRSCLFTLRGRSIRIPRESTGRAVQPRRSSIDDLRRCRKRQAGSG